MFSIGWPSFSLLDLGVMACMLLGSSSIGSAWLRMGFPGVILLPKDTRTGAALVAGMVYAFLVILSTLVLSVFFSNSPFQFFLFLQMSLVLVIGGIVLGVKHVYAHKKAQALPGFRQAVEVREKSAGIAGNSPTPSNVFQGASSQAAPAPLEVPSTASPAPFHEAPPAPSQPAAMETVLRTEPVNFAVPEEKPEPPSLSEVRKALKELHDQVRAGKKKIEEE